MPLVNKLFPVINNRFERKVLLSKAIAKPKKLGVDAENASEEWFQDALNECKSLSYCRSKRFPDYLVWMGVYDNSCEMYEIKARIDEESHINFNSTFPLGRKKDQDVFYVFMNYNPADLMISTISVTHGSYWTGKVSNNICDEFKSDTKPIKNTKLTVRKRFFYEGQSPKGECQELTGRCSLVLPAEWSVPDGMRKLCQVGNFNAFIRS